MQQSRQSQQSRESADQPEGGAGRPSRRLHTADQAAEILQCKPSWLKEKARTRLIPFTLVGGSYHFTDAHIDSIIQNFEQQPQTPAAAPARRRRPTPQPDTATGVTVLRSRPPRRGRA